MSRWTLGAALVTLVLAVASWAVQAGQPRQQVVVATRNLPAGHRLGAADLAVIAVPISADRGRHLLPASVAGLVPGEYLTRAIVGGAPVRDDQIRPAASGQPALAEPPDAVCEPSS